MCWIFILKIWEHYDQNLTGMHMFSDEWQKKPIRKELHMSSIEKAELTCYVFEGKVTVKIEWRVWGPSEGCQCHAVFNLEWWSLYMHKYARNYKNNLWKRQLPATNHNATMPWTWYKHKLLNSLPFPILEQWKKPFV